MDGLRMNAGDHVCQAQLQLALKAAQIKEKETDLGARQIWAQSTLLKLCYSATE